MPSLTADEMRAVGSLIASRRPGYSLPGEFYSSELVYRAELERIWRRGWLFAGHTCEIPNPGDYFTLSVDADSLIIIRDDGGEIRALWNVCRHRGTQICSEPQGRVGRLVCPYHQWTYARDGSLVSCRGMQEDIDKRELGLLRAPVARAGRVYFCFAVRRSARFRRGRGGDRALRSAARTRSREGGEDRRLRRRRELEDRVGEQSRMLPLQRESPAIHQGELRSLQRRRHERADSVADRARRWPAAKRSGRRRAWP